MEREHLQNIDVSWGHEPRIRKALEIKECMFRFMESLYDLKTAHRDHEPERPNVSARQRLGLRQSKTWRQFPRSGSGKASTI